MTPKAFRAALERLGFSQAEFSRFIKVERQTVYRWAAGINEVPQTVELLLVMIEHVGIERARDLAENRAELLEE